MADINLNNLEFNLNFQVRKLGEKSGYKLPDSLVSLSGKVEGLLDVLKEPDELKETKKFVAQALKEVGGWGLTGFFYWIVNPEIRKTRRLVRDVGRKLDILLKAIPKTSEENRATSRKQPQGNFSNIKDLIKSKKCLKSYEEITKVESPKDRVSLFLELTKGGGLGILWPRIGKEDLQVRKDLKKACEEAKNEKGVDPSLQTTLGKMITHLDEIEPKAGVERESVSMQLLSVMSPTSQENKKEANGGVIIPCKLSKKAPSDFAKLIPGGFPEAAVKTVMDAAKISCSKELLVKTLKEDGVEYLTFPNPDQSISFTSSLTFLYREYKFERGISKITYTPSGGSNEVKVSLSKRNGTNWLPDDIKDLSFTRDEFNSLWAKIQASPSV